MGFLCLLPCDDRHRYDTRCHDGQEVYYNCWIFLDMYDMQTESSPLGQQFRNHKILVHPICKMKKERGPNWKSNQCKTKKRETKTIKSLCFVIKLNCMNSSYDNFIIFFFFNMRLRGWLYHTKNDWEWILLKSLTNSRLYFSCLAEEFQNHCNTRKENRILKTRFYWFSVNMI